MHTRISSIHGHSYKIRALVLVSSIGLAIGLGCHKGPSEPPGTDDGKDSDGTDGNELVCVEAEAPAPTSCGTQRRIVRRDGRAPCSDGGIAWTGARLRQEGPLANYCVYERNDPSAPPPYDSVSDCPAYAQAVDAEHWSYWSSVFAQGVGTVDTTQLAVRWSPVRIAVIDTGTGCTSTATHGRMMTSLVRDVANGCFAKQGCEREVHSYVGLPRRLDDMTQQDTVCGGEVGYASDVAVAIQRALDDWRHSGKREKLIINLSVAWSSEPGPLTSQPVYEMLRRASCHGALIIAAAGNRSPYSCTDSTFAPAQWEALRRPSKKECMALGIDAPDLPPNGYTPLVHSVTPISHSQQDLLSNSPAAASRIAALGFQATSVDHSGVPIGPMSGSSVSAAVVSGVAALVWSANSTLTADGVMQRLWDSGTERFDADVQTYLKGTQQPTQRVISACGALALPCDFPTPESVQSQLANPGTPAIQIAGKPLPECKACATGGAPSPKGMESAPQAEPTANPQPSKTPCPPCWANYDPGATPQTSVHLQLSNDFPQEDTPTGFVITLTNASGARKSLYYVNGPAAPLLTTNTMNVLQDPSLDDVDGAPPARAWIEVYFQSPTGGSYSAGNELSVVTH